MVMVVFILLHSNNHNHTKDFTVTYKEYLHQLITEISNHTLEKMHASI